MHKYYIEIDSERKYTIDELKRIQNALKKEMDCKLIHFIKITKAEIEQKAYRGIVLP